MISQHLSFCLRAECSYIRSRQFLYSGVYFACISVLILRKEVVADVNKSDLPFSMYFDETTTAQVKKQMDLTLCYWSPTHNEVTVTYTYNVNSILCFLDMLKLTK